MPDLRKRLKNAAVSVDTAEVFVLQPDISSLEPEIARAAELGARSIVAIHVFPGPEDQAADKLAALAELAGSYNLRVSFEPIAMGVTRTPSEGLRMLKRSGAKNAGSHLGPAASHANRHADRVTPPNRPRLDQLGADLRWPPPASIPLSPSRKRVTSAPCRAAARFPSSTFCARCRLRSCWAWKCR